MLILIITTPYRSCNWKCNWKYNSNSNTKKFRIQRI